MDGKDKWLETGYRHFAEFGPDQLSIKRIASEMDVSRSTFYNHFADKENLIEALLEKHMMLTESFKDGVRERCKVYSPDLFVLLAQYPESIKFHRQLFLNRHNPVCNMVFTSIQEKINQVTVPLFKAFYEFNVHYHTAEDLYNSLVDSWYAKMDTDDLTAGSMQLLSDEIAGTLVRFVKSRLFVQMQE
jgi:AcrR family transcriptional regulator